MNALDAIAARRSIRRFKPDPVPEELIRQVLHAGTLAPSGKNRQPWEFVIVREERRAELFAAMREGLEWCRDRGFALGSSENTARIMEQAPVTILVYDPAFEGTGSIEDLGRREGEDLGKWIWELVDVQSVGACIQNMCLAAVELGLGTLWIADTTYAYDPICAWLGRTDLFVAALALGWPGESPDPRPRKPVDEITTWL